MKISVSIRELARKSDMLLEYDYVDIEDKKSHSYKGVFVPSRYADEVKAYLDKKIAKEQQKRLDTIMQFSGILDGETGDLSIQELKASKKEKY
ncbi:MAG: hypothetical protein HGA78_04175 [Nitrospirales bacterium]|nr:hypothetical protein [Nitrospirales bacterium]